MDNTIKVDIENLLDVLEDMRSDGYVTAQFSIVQEEGTDKELLIGAVDIGEGEVKIYSSLLDTEYEFE